MKINMPFIKQEISNLVSDKLDNMCNSEISKELYEFLQDEERKEILCYSVYSILYNNECVIDDGYINFTAKEGFKEDLILNWDHIEELSEEEQEKEIQSTILYNYDSLWMSAIHKAFPELTTDIQCGYGEMDLLSL